jgi:hypothetical protein
VALIARAFGIDHQHFTVEVAGNVQRAVARDLDAVRSAVGRYVNGAYDPLRP